VLDGPLAPVAIPATLQDSLMARLDRLSSARQVAQVGAALAANSRTSCCNACGGDCQSAQLSDAWSNLFALSYSSGAARHRMRNIPLTCVGAGCCVCQSASANRQQLHARIARAYETRFPEVVRAQPELVAHHFTEAGLSDAAIEYWQRAGDLAMARSGHAEAIHPFPLRWTS